jgi:hypothetical protein
MEGIYLAQDRDQWRYLVNMVRIFGVQKKVGEILEKLSDWRLLKKGSSPWS